MQIKIEQCVNGYILTIEEMRILLSQEMLNDLGVEVESVKYGTVAKLKLEPAPEKKPAVKEKKEKLVKAVKPAKPARKRPEPVVKKEKPVKETGKKWSKKYDQCQECGTTEKRHMSGGLCSVCYMRNKRKESADHTDKVLKLKRKTVKKGESPYARNHRYSSSDQELTSCANKYKCVDCQYEFVSVLDEDEANCPECDSGNVERMD
jgi:hypothetical protein